MAVIGGGRRIRLVILSSGAEVTVVVFIFFSPSAKGRENFPCLISSVQINPLLTSGFDKEKIFFPYQLAHL